MNNKSIGIKMVNGERNKILNNHIQADIGIYSEGGKDNILQGNKINEKRKRISLLTWILGIIGMVIAGLILYLLGAN